MQCLSCWAPDCTVSQTPDLPVRAESLCPASYCPVSITVSLVVWSFLDSTWFVMFTACRVVVPALLCQVWDSWKKCKTLNAKWFKLGSLQTNVWTCRLFQPPYLFYFIQKESGWHESSQSPSICGFSVSKKKKRSTPVQICVSTTQILSLNTLSQQRFYCAVTVVLFLICHFPFCSSFEWCFLLANPRVSRAQTWSWAGVVVNLGALWVGGTGSSRLQPAFLSVFHSCSSSVRFVFCEIKQSFGIFLSPICHNYFLIAFVRLPDCLACALQGTQN